MTVYRVPRDSMPEPRAFGYFDGKDIYIRNDIPTYAQEYVYDHELRHLLDKGRTDIVDTFTREQRANVYGFRKHWKGALWVLWHTITSWQRLTYYWERIRDGK